MTDILIQPNADADDNLANGVVINDATLPLSNQDAATLGLTLGTTYKARVLGAPETFSVTDVPAQMSAPTLAVDSDTQITATLASDPADNGSAINGYDLRYSTDEATWTEEIGITSPHAITGLSGSTLYYVQTRATNGNGAGAWSASASVTTDATVSTPVLDGVSITDDGGGSGTMTLTFDAGETNGTSVEVWGYIDNPGDTDPADGAAVAAGTGAEATFNVTTTVGASGVSVPISGGPLDGTYDVFVTASYDSGSTYSNVVSDTGVTFDTAAPTISSVVTNAAGDEITLTFSEALTNTATDATDFTMSGHTLSAFSGSGTTWTMSVSPAVAASTDVDTLDYSATTGDLEDANGNALASFSGQSIDNSAVTGTSFDLAYTDNDFIDNAGSTATTYTFASQSLGAADATREIYVGIASLRLSGECGAPSVAIGGVPASVVQASPDLPSNHRVDVYKATVPTGTTGTVEATYASGGDPNSVAIGLVRVVNRTNETTATGFEPSASTTFNANINTASGGAVMAFASTVNGSNWTVTGVTENADFDYRSGEIFFVGTETGLSAETPRTIETSNSGTDNKLISVAVN